MINQIHEPPKTRKRFGGLWDKLDYLCKKIHFWWYVRKDKTYAKRYLGRLERVLKELPENDLAIVREEGWALLHQLRGEKNLAIKHRQREIELIEMAHQSVRQSVNAGRYDETMAKSILGDRDIGGLRERRAILKTLERGI